jgi:hypothetical protein
MIVQYVYVATNLYGMLFSLYQSEKSECSQKSIFQLGEVILGKARQQLHILSILGTYHSDCHIANVG